MKKCIILFYLVTIMFLDGCASKKTKQTGQSYYKLALLDLEEEDSGSQKYSRALINIDKALACHKEPRALALKATILFAMNHDAHAQRYFLEAIEMCDSSSLKADIENNYACLLAQKGEIEKAHAIWNSLLNNVYYTTPEVVLVNQGKCFMMQQRYDEALEKMTEASRKDPQYVDAYYYCALISYFHRRTISQAQEMIGRVLSLAPLHKGATQLKSLLERPNNLSDSYKV